MSALTSASGGSLDTLVDLPRGLTEAEARAFLTTGELPEDLRRFSLREPAVAGSTIAGEPWLPTAPTDGQVRDYLAGATADLTASGWDAQDHPRDANGRFIEKGALRNVLSKMVKTTGSQLRQAVAQLTQKRWDTLTDDQRDDVRAQVDKLPSNAQTTGLKAKVAKLTGAGSKPPLAGQAALDAAPATLTPDPNGHSGHYAAAVLDAPEGAGTARALAEYEGLEYQHTNDFLRGKYRDPDAGTPVTGDEDFLEGTPERIADIDRTMAASRLTSDVVTYRVLKEGARVFGQDTWYGGIIDWNTTDFAEQDRQFERWEAGERPDLTGLRWQDPGYASTSVDLGVVEEFGKRWPETNSATDGEPVVLTIRTPAGIGAVQLSPLGKEAELLLERGLVMEVVADNGIVGGFRRLDVRVVPTGEAKELLSDEDSENSQVIPGESEAANSVGRLGEDTPEPQRPTAATAIGDDEVAVAGIPVVPAVIYKKHPHGAVVAVSPDGERRLRWNAGAKKYAVDRQTDDGWAEEESLTKVAAYEAVKDPAHWVVPGGGKKSKTTTSPVKTQPDAPVETSTKPTENEAVEPPPTPVQVPTVVQPTAKKAAATSPGPHYTGLDDSTDPLVRELADLMLRHQDSSVPRADKVAGQERMAELQKKLGATDAEKARLRYNTLIELNFRGFHKLVPELADLDDDEAKDELARRAREAFAGKKIAVRTTNAGLGRILADGRLKSPLEGKKITDEEHADVAERRMLENAWFGTPPSADAETRPVYGYVALDGVRPAGLATSVYAGASTDALSTEGRVQVVLKDSVRDRTTAMYGDAIWHGTRAMPGPVDDPGWKAFSTPGSAGPAFTPLLNLERDDASFRSNYYAEAHVHGGVTVDDVAEVVFPSSPPAALRKSLDSAGVPWRVLNWENASEEPNPEDRTRLLRIAEQDLDNARGWEEKFSQLAAEAGGGQVAEERMLQAQKYAEQRKTIESHIARLRASLLGTSDDKTTSELATVTQSPPRQLSEAEAAERGRNVDKILSKHRDLATDRTQASHVPGVGTVWNPDRDAVHRQIVDDVYSRSKAPRDGRAVIMGGPTGAGKTTVLKNQAGVDLDDYLVINPDDFKEELTRRGLAPTVPGAEDLSPLELAGMIHAESMHLANMLARRAYLDRRNVAWDISMGSHNATAGHLRDLRANGYDHVTGVLVDVSPETSRRRAYARYREGLNDWLAGTGQGGRFIPRHRLDDQHDDRGRSWGRQTFEGIRGEFDAWQAYDNDVDGRKAKLIRKGGSK